MNYIGIDLGGTTIKAAVVTREGNILLKGSCPTNSTGSFEHIVRDMGLLCHKLVKDAGLTMDDITAAGVGIPGIANSSTGIVHYVCNLGWNNVPFSTELRKYIDKPIFLTNDANAAALGEAKFGASKQYSDSVFITLGTGVGGGVIIGGKLFEGNMSAGTELGHMKIAQNGIQCNCGRKDCWEVYSSASAIIRETKEAMRKYPASSLWKHSDEIDEVDGKTVFDAAAEGDAAAQEVIDVYIQHLGEALINIANIFRPEIILIGGGLSAQSAILLPPINKMMDEYVHGGNVYAKVLVEAATLKNDAGFLGAVALCL